MTSEYTHPEPPLSGDEVATLLGSLERQRSTFAWKCDGLDAESLNRTFPPSTMTLGGLLKHMALVEDDMFANLLLGVRPGPPWNEVDWKADPDWEWHSAAENSPEELMALWRAATERSRAIVSEALTKGDLGQLGLFKNEDDPRPEYRGKSPSLRRILIDLIEEYARHVGHADLFREAIDGLVGEDPPGGWRPGF
jgi:hypothetical protein